MAAPIGSQILGEVLPYLEVIKDNQKEEDIKKEVVVPNIQGMSILEAEKLLKDSNLIIEVQLEEGMKKSEIIVKEQLPKHGIKVYEGTKISVTI